MILSYLIKLLDVEIFYYINLSVKNGSNTASPIKLAPLIEFDGKRLQIY